MRAELVMIGTELLLGNIVDTNAAYLAEKLGEIGIDVYYKSTVGDNWLRMVEVLSQAISRSDIVITSGGLGPTLDDLTRECIAAVCNRPLALDESALADIRNYFAQRGREMSNNNEKQAWLPEGSQAIPNSWGTAPGILLELPGKVVIALPGVPRELKGMFETTVLPYLAELAGGAPLWNRILRFVGIGESQMEQLVRDILAKQSNPTIAPYASLGECRLRITAKASSKEEAERLIAPVEEELRVRLGDWLFGVDDETLERAVGRELNRLGHTLATAESCSGGLIAHRLTNVPGSSTYFERGFVTYSNEAKMELLGVPREILAAHGAVSEETARAMAEGARRQAKTDWAVAVTGIAGPGGGSKEKPVGLVHMAVAGKEGVTAEVHRFHGNREEIKFMVSQAALRLLWQELKKTK